MATIHLRSACRRLLRHKAFSLINILGLSIGLAACLLLSLYVQYELSYDAYNDKAARIVRVTSNIHSAESDISMAGTPSILGPTLLRDCPEVEAAVRIEQATFNIRQNGEMISATNFVYTEPAIFSVFSFSFLQGSPLTALKNPNSIVLTQSAAKHYLGAGTALGRTLTANGIPYQVTAIISDRPGNSDLTIDALVSKDFKSTEDWVTSDFDDYTFLLFRNPPDIRSFNNRLPALTTKYSKPALAKADLTEYSFTFSAEKLTDVHFSTGKLEETPKGNRQFVTIFSILAGVILVIALLNYINLSTTKAIERAKEVAVRKVIGARPARLVRQFLAESSFLIAIAWIIAFGLLLVAIPLFNRLLSIHLALAGWQTLILPLLLFPLTTLLAGGYPAFVLSRFSPIKSLKGHFQQQGKGVGLRKTLTVIQFAIALMMLAGTVAIYHQMQFVAHKDLVMDRNGIVCINIPRDSAIDGAAPAFITSLRQESSIHDISVGSGFPTDGFQLGSTTGAVNGKKRILMNHYFYIDPNLLPLLHIPLVAGRNFSDSLQTDKKQSFIVNQAFVNKMGWKTGLGESLEGGGVKGQVVGVVKDFFFQSLHNAIAPVVMVFRTDPPLAILLKTTPAELPRLKQLWKAHFPATPFDYYFMDESLAKQYDKDRTTMTLFNAFTALAIFICFIGIFGLISLLVIRRTKEIGIRKVLGATVTHLITLFTNDLLLLVGIAAIIALPLAAIGANRWMSSYAYHAGLSAWIFATPLLLILALTLLVAGLRILQAAVANPVSSLRTE
jgi:putative ABC transport system permease protein